MGKFFKIEKFVNFFDNFFITVVWKMPIGLLLLGLSHGNILGALPRNMDEINATLEHFSDNCDEEIVKKKSPNFLKF